MIQRSVLSVTLFLVAINKYPKHLEVFKPSNDWMQWKKSLIQSKLDYGAPIYGLGKISSLKLLDPILNSAIHIITGAFRTSSTESLTADSGIPPLSFRHILTATNLPIEARAIAELEILLNPYEGL